MTAERRETSIDFLRAAMILYVVGWWHLLTYIGPGTQHVNWASSSLTNIVLGTFTFISGYLLGQWRGGLDSVAFLDYLRRRVIRVYPLYLTALVAFVLTWITDVGTALKAAVLVSMFFPDPPATLWFITMVMVFYLVLPWIARPPAIIAAAIGVGLWCLMLAIHTFHTIDARIVMFFPAFVGGALYRRLRQRPGRSLEGLVAIAAALAFALTHALPANPMRAALLSVPAVLLGSLLAFMLAGRFCGGIGAIGFVQQLSYASFSVYLFHRVVFELAIRAYWPPSAWEQAAYLLGACMPLSLLIGWTVQRGYDRLRVIMGRPDG